MSFSMREGIIAGAALVLGAGGMAFALTAGGMGGEANVEKSIRSYLLKHPDTDCRFDCVLIDGNKLEWLRNAFSADD